MERIYDLKTSLWYCLASRSAIH